MSATQKLSRHEAAEFMERLRRDISAARLRVSLDKKLGRVTPASVRKLASLPEPPTIEKAAESVSAGSAAALLGACIANFRDVSSSLNEDWAVLVGRNALPDIYLRQPRESLEEREVRSD